MQKNRISQLLDNSVKYSLGTMAARAIQLILQPVFLYFLTTEEFGIQGIAFLNEQILGIITGYAIRTGIGKHYTDARNAGEDGGRVIGTALYGIGAIGIVIIATWQIFAVQITSLTLDASPTSVMVIRLVGISFFANMIFNIGQAIRQLRQMIARFSIALMLQITLGGILGLALLIAGEWIWTSYTWPGPSWVYMQMIEEGWKGMGVVSLLAGWTVSCLIVGIWALVWLVTEFTMTFDKKTFKKIASYGFPMLPAAFLQFALNGNDMYLLKVLTDPGHLLPGMVKTMTGLELAGVYSMVLKLTKGLHFVIIAPFMLAWPPMMWKMRKEPDEASFHRRTLTYYFAAQMLIWCGVAVFCDLMMHVVSTGRTEFMAAAFAVPAVHLGAIFLGTWGLLGAGFQFDAKTHYYTVSMACATLVSVVCNITLIPILGIWSCAAAFASAQFVFALSCFVWGHRYFPVHFEWWRIARVFICAGITVGLGLMARSIDGWTGIITAAGVVALYPALLYLLRFYTPSDFQHVKQFYTNAVNRLKKLSGVETTRNNGG